MSAHPDPSTEQELPEPSAALVCSRIIVEAWLLTVDRQLGARFLENLALVVSSQEEMMQVIPIQRTKRGRASATAEREALAALRQNISVWLARLQGI